MRVAPEQTRSEHLTARRHGVARPDTPPQLRGQVTEQRVSRPGRRSSLTRQRSAIRAAGRLCVQLRDNHAGSLHLARDAHGRCAAGDLRVRASRGTPIIASHRRGRAAEPGHAASNRPGDEPAPREDPHLSRHMQVRSLLGRGTADL